jgi:HSP20 family protein
MYQTQYSWPRQSSGIAVSNPVSSSIVPRMDIIETKDEFIYILEMPGITSDQINVEMEGRNIYVSGNVKEIISSQEPTIYHLQERVSSSFQRVIPLTSVIEDEQVKAEMFNGLLFIKMRKGKKSMMQERQKVNVTEM